MPFKVSVRTAQETISFTAIQTSILIIGLLEINTVFLRSTRKINTHCGEKIDFLVLNLAVHDVTTGL